jgi:hypothetical protein
MMTIAPLKGAGFPADVGPMPVRRQPLIAAVLPTLQREDVAVDRKPARGTARPRVKGARASLADVEAAAAELQDRGR